MALTNELRKRLDIPHEDGQWVTVRKLSHYQISMAEDARFAAITAKLKALDGIKLPDGDPNATVKAADKYDRLTVLRSGVTEWSYGVPPAEGVAELDEDTAAWLFGEIIAFSIRSVAEGEASAVGSPFSTSSTA